MHIAICDGNSNDLKDCKNMLVALGSKHHIDVSTKLYKTPEQLVFDLSSNPNQTDLVIMEVEFAEDMDGIQAAKKLRELEYINEIIFFSGDTTRIQDAFDVSAMHFLVKRSTSEKRFEEVFLLAASKMEKKKQEVIILTCANESRSIPLQEIKYFEFFKRLIVVHYRDEEFEFYSTLSKLEDLLCEKGFVRTHKGFLVSLNAIESITGTDIILKDETVLPLSRSYSKAVRQSFSEVKSQSI